MNIISFLIVGLIAGWIASVLMKGRGLGAIGNMIVGIVGALIGGFIFDMTGVVVYGFWSALGMSIVGAIVFLFIVSLISGNYGRPLKKL